MAVICLERRAQPDTVVEAVHLTFPRLTETLQARAACLGPVRTLGDWSPAPLSHSNAASLSVAPTSSRKSAVKLGGRSRRSHLRCDLYLFNILEKSSPLARKRFLFVKEDVKQRQVKNDFFTQS